MPELAGTVSVFRIHSSGEDSEVLEQLRADLALGRKMKKNGRVRIIIHHPGLIDSRADLKLLPWGYPNDGDNDRRDEIKAKKLTNREELTSEIVLQIDRSVVSDQGNFTHRESFHVEVNFGNLRMLQVEYIDYTTAEHPLVLWRQEEGEGGQGSYKFYRVSFDSAMATALEMEKRESGSGF